MPQVALDAEAAIARLALQRAAAAAARRASAPAEETARPEPTEVVEAGVPYVPDFSLAAVFPTNEAQSSQRAGPQLEEDKE